MPDQVSNEQPDLPGPRPLRPEWKLPDRVVELGAVAARFVELVLPGLDPWKKRLPMEARADAVRLLAQSVGFRYARCDLVNFEIEWAEQQEAIDRLVELLRNLEAHSRSGAGLLIYGNPGTGKDHLIVGLLKLAILHYGFDCAWRDGMQLIDEIGDAIREDRLGRKLRDLASPHILAISDPVPPRGDLHDTMLRRVRDVIEYRYRRGVPTWITTNIETDEAARQLLTLPLMDRLRDHAFEVYCNWPSYRDAAPPIG